MIHTKCGRDSFRELIYMISIAACYPPKGLSLIHLVLQRKVFSKNNYLHFFLLIPTKKLLWAVLFCWILRLSVYLVFLAPPYISPLLALRCFASGQPQMILARNGSMLLSLFHLSLGGPSGKWW